MYRTVALIALVLVALAAATDASTRVHLRRRHKTLSSLMEDPTEAEADKEMAEDIESLEGGGEVEVPAEEEASETDEAFAAEAEESLNSCAAECGAKQKELAADQLIERNRMEEVEHAEEKAQDAVAQYNALNKLIHHAEMIAAALPEKKAKLDALKAKVGDEVAAASAKEASVELHHKERQLSAVNARLNELEQKTAELDIEKKDLMAQIAKLEEQVISQGGTITKKEDSAETSGDGAGETEEAAPAEGEEAAPEEPQFRQKFDDDFMF